MLSGARKVLSVMGKVLDMKESLVNFFYQWTNYINYNFFILEDVNNLLDEETFTLEEKDLFQQELSQLQTTYESKIAEDSKKDFSKENYEEIYRLPKLTGLDELDIPFKSYETALQLFGKENTNEAFILFKEIIKTLKMSTNEEAKLTCAKSYYYLGLCYILTSNKQKKAALDQFITALSFLKLQDKNTDYLFCLIIFEIIKLEQSPEFIVDGNNIDKILEINRRYESVFRTAPDGSHIKKELSKKFIKDGGFFSLQMLKLIDTSYQREFQEVDKRDKKLLQEFIDALNKNDLSHYTYEKVFKIMAILIFGMKIRCARMSLDDLKEKFKHILGEVKSLLQKFEEEINPNNKIKYAKTGVLWCLILEMTQIPSFILESASYKNLFAAYIQKDPANRHFQVNLSPKITEPLYYFVGDESDLKLEMKNEVILVNRLVKTESTIKEFSPKNGVSEIKLGQNNLIIKSELMHDTKPVQDKSIKNGAKLKSALNDKKNNTSTKRESTQNAGQLSKNIEKKLSVNPVEKQQHKKILDEEPQNNSMAIHSLIAEAQETIHSYKTKTSHILQSLRELKNISESEPTQSKASELIAQHAKAKEIFLKNISKIEKEKNEIKVEKAKDQRKLNNLISMLEKKPSSERDENEIQKLFGKILVGAEKARNFDSKFNRIEKEIKLILSIEESIKAELKLMSNLSAKEEKDLHKIEVELERLQKIISDKLKEVDNPLSDINNRLKEINRLIESFHPEGMLHSSVLVTQKALRFSIEDFEKRITQLKWRASETSQILQTALLKQKQDYQLKFIHEFKEIDHALIKSAEILTNINLTNVEKKINELEYVPGTHSKIIDKDHLKRIFSDIIEELKFNEKNIQQAKIIKDNFEKFHQLHSKELSKSHTSETSSLFTKHHRLEQEIAKTEKLIANVRAKGNANFELAVQEMEKEQQLIVILEEIMDQNLIRVQSGLDRLNQIEVKSTSDINKKLKEIENVKVFILKLQDTIKAMEKYNPHLFKINIKGILQKIDLSDKDCQKAYADINAYHKNSLSVLNLNDDLAEVHELALRYPGHQIELKGGAVFLLGLYHYANNEFKVGKIEDIDLLIFSDNIRELSSRLEREGFIFSGQDFKGKHINLRKKCRSGKYIDITVADRKKYNGDEFITGPASAKMVMINDVKDENIDIHTGLGFGLAFQKESKENSYFQDFMTSLTMKKYFVSKYNPDNHKKYFKNIIKYKKKMVEAFGDSCLKVQKSESLKDFSFSGSQVLYHNVLDGLTEHCKNELKLSPPKDRTIFLEINAVIKCFGICDEDVQPYLQALIQAMIEKVSMNFSKATVEKVVKASIEALKSKYESNPFLSDKNSPLLSSEKNIGTEQMRKDFEEVIAKQCACFRVKKFPKNYSKTPQLYFNQQTPRTQFIPFSQIRISDDKGENRLLTLKEITQSKDVFSYHHKTGYTRMSQKELLELSRQPIAAQILYRLYCPMTAQGIYHTPYIPIHGRPLSRK